jgi:hypothetical protein
MAWTAEEFEVQFIAGKVTFLTTVVARQDVGQHSSCAKVSRAVTQIFPCLRANLPYPVVDKTCPSVVCYHSMPLVLHCYTVFAVPLQV